MSFALFIHAAVDCVQQSFRQVCPCAEELHFFTSFSCGYTAADCVVIFPYWTHNIVVFVLDRRSFNRDFCSVIFECLWQTRRIQDCHVWFWRRSHVLQSAQETEVILRNQSPAVHPHTSDRQCSPNWVAREQFVVARNPCEFHHTQFHNQVVNQFLRLFFCQSTVFQVPLDVDIQES